MRETPTFSVQKNSNSYQLVTESKKIVKKIGKYVKTFNILHSKLLDEYSIVDFDDNF